MASYKEIHENEQKVIAAGREDLWDQAAKDPQAAEVFADWWEEQGNADAARNWREHAAALLRGDRVWAGKYQIRGSQGEWAVVSTKRYYGDVEEYQSVHKTKRGAQAEVRRLYAGKPKRRYAKRRVY